MRLVRYILGFVVALVASTLIAVVTLELSTALQEGRNPNVSDILSVGMFALPIVFLGAIVIGLPVYLYGQERGWFDTLGRSTATGAAAGSFFGAAVCFLISSSTFSGILLFFAAGTIAGSIAGAIWWAFVGAINPAEQQL